MGARSSFTRLGVGAFTLLLTLVLLLVVTGLFATDVTLRAAGKAHAQSDAEHAAAMLEYQLAARVEGMAVFEAVSLDAAPEGRARRFLTMANLFAATHPACIAIALADSSGRIVMDHELPTDTVTGPATLRSAVEAALRVDPGSSIRLVALARPSRRAIMVARPLAGAPQWSAVALFDIEPFLSSLTGRTTTSTDGIVLMVAGDTLWSRPSAAGRGGGAIGEALVEVPVGEAWRLTVIASENVRGARIALWLLGAMAGMLLATIVIRERRQATRVAERSAELERLSTELLRANRMKSEFLANVSHELRTPLNAIVGFVELLKDGVYGSLSPRQVSPVDRIAVSATHLRQLVDQVLDIAKIAAGRLEVHTETVTLRTFVLNVASELESLFSERGLSLSITVPAVLPKVRTDPTHLRQILVNLIGNAVTYTPAGSVSIRARLLGPAVRGTSARGEEAPLVSRAVDRSRPWVILQVVDTGVGIPAEDHERIFDEFEQVEPGSRGDSMERGTGLGLPISRRLARLLGGDVTVESQVGKGSTFTVWLPVEAAALEQSATPGRAVSPS